MTNLSVLLVSTVLVLTACSAATKKKKTTASGTNKISDSQVSWSYKQEQNGYGEGDRRDAGRPTAANTFFSVAYAGRAEGHNSSVAFCFDNHWLADAAAEGAPFICQMAARDVQEIGVNYAVPITAFDLWLDKSGYSSLSITAASVTTGEVRFDSDGKFVPVNVKVKNLMNSAVSVCTSSSCPNSCNPNAGSAAGAAFSFSDPRIVTGIYIMSEAVQMSTSNIVNHNQGRAKAVRVYHRALLQTTQGLEVGFDFLPELSEEPAMVWFGAESGSSPFGGTGDVPATSSTYEQVHFGLSANDAYTIPQASEHVVLGWCLDGNKYVTGNTNVKPLLYRTITEKSQPSLVMPDTDEDN